jgi:hypothetical protein
MNELICHKNFNDDTNIINHNINGELALVNVESNDLKLKPWYITGLTDGEGSFQITIQDMKGKGLTGFKPFLEFKITQKKYSHELLIKVKEFFQCGRISVDNSKTETMKYVVTDINDIVGKVIPHFDQYNLKTSKYLNFIDFKEGALLLFEKEHFTLFGISKLRNIKSRMNRARSFEDKFNFCWNHCLEVVPEWIQGFIDGEGSFQCEIIKPRSRTSNYFVNFSLQIKQNNHDVAILNAIKIYFYSGFLKPKFSINSLYETKNCSRSTTTLWIRDVGKVITLLDNYTLFSTKQLDYLDWKQLIYLKAQKEHHSDNGISVMNAIKNGMNSKRFK